MNLARILTVYIFLSEYFFPIYAQVSKVIPSYHFSKRNLVYLVLSILSYVQLASPIS
jgi:hypothetical protein